MKIYKFGGASVKDADGVKNLLKILKEVGYDETLIIISAMGKMTNAFEKITSSYYNKNKDLSHYIETAIAFHKDIIEDLFVNLKTEILTEIEDIFDELLFFTDNNSVTDYNYIYDQIVSKAELISTKICSYYLSENGIPNKWLDVRKCIKTNSDYRRAGVDWEKTSRLIKEHVNGSSLIITQGFIASDHNNNTTTLGREGSDYTAGIFAYCLDAEKTIIFKDVAGVLNADPRNFDDTTLLNQISYREAIEMAFYGASVIHPKTLQPLQRKEIPLFVKSFKNPKNEGTIVCKGANLIPKTPCFIVKKDQILLSISAKDFSFIMEDDISEIFDFFHQYKLKVNLIQNSAISFSVCLEDNFNAFNKLYEKLKLNYLCLYNKNVSLFTIRHFTKASIMKIEKNKEVLVKQLSRETVQIVVKN
jgi:aspartate kinase